MNSRVIVKNVKTTPAFADNDGRTAAACSCVVFTAADDAAVVSAEIDLSPLAGPPRAPLKPRAGQRLPGTNDGAYAARFTVPQLTDPGRYELPIAARDSAGNAGAGRARFDVIYRRPDYRGGPLAPDNQRALARLAGSPIAPGNRVEVLADGAAAMDKRLAMLAAAKKQINLQTYLFDREVGGARFYDALLARFNAGVQANIILNADTQIPAALLSTLRLSFHHLLSEISEFLGTLRPTTPAERRSGKRRSSNRAASSAISTGTPSFRSMSSSSGTWPRASWKKRRSSRSPPLPRLTPRPFRSADGGRWRVRRRRRVR